MASEQNLQELKDSITDPITMRVMTDPHSITVCNHTFDKATIDEWVAAGNDSCLICREHFTAEQVKPNFAMRDTIKTVLPLIEQLDQQNLNSEPQPEQNDEVENPDPPSDIVEAKADDPIETKPSFRFLTLGNEHLMIEIVNPEGTEETPSDMVICIDISGSMSQPVTRKGEDGSEISDGLTTLDVVKHAALSLIQRLSDADRVALVTFESAVVTVMELTVMNEEGRREAERTIKSLRPRGQTNFWGGIERSLDLLQAVGPLRNSVACILTDGVPSQQFSPTRGYMGALKKYRDRHPELSVQVNMIGFGYSLDSALLDEISREMNGSYAFVPDGTMTGTVFIHIGANVAVTSGTNAQLKLEFGGEGDVVQRILDDRLTDLDTCYSWSRSARELSISLGSLSYGQNRSIVIPIAGIESAALTYTDVKERRAENLFVDAPEVIEAADGSAEAESVKSQLFRQMLVSSTRRAMNFASIGDLDSAQNLLQETYRKMSDVGIHSGSECADIGKDLTGQISEAFSRGDWYNRWGKHYLPSLACAHINQICNNFKDPGVQRLGGTLFEKVRDYIDEQFNSLPDPQPSAAPSYAPAFSASKQSAASGGIAPSFSGLMASYNSSAAACFRGDCIVELFGGEMKRVDKILKGDRVATQARGGWNEVDAVVVSRCGSGKAAFVKFENGLVITPWHPILIDGVWRFPVDVVGAFFEEECEFVYNFVLRDGHVMVINGVGCVTLGHGFDDNDCVKHAYYGTGKVVDDLRKLNGYDAGRVVVDGNVTVRDERTGLIVGMNVENV